MLGSDSHVFLMVTCLLGVPLLTALIAFVIVEVSVRKGEERDPFRPRHALGSSPRTSVQSVFTDGGYMAHQHPTSHNLQTGAFLPNPGSAPNGLHAMMSPPASVRRLYPTPSLGVPQEVFPRTSLLQPPTTDSLAEDECSGSPLSTALLVKNPAGTLVRLDGVLVPHPESRTVNVLSVKDNEVILCAHVSENSMASSIHVETKANNIPIAVMDTGEAIFHRTALRPPPEKRRVILHRVIGEDRGATGPPCAWVGPMAGGVFLVHYMCPQEFAPGVVGDIALTVHTSQGNSGTYVERMIDSQGQVVSKSETIGYGHKALWVKQGCDMAFVACVALAIQKLA